jgi:D-lactate dehydrogenase
MFSTKPFDRRFFDAANIGNRHDITYFEPRLDAETARLASGFSAVCAFVNDRLDSETLEALAAGGTRLIALRSAGFNHVDLRAADRLGQTVMRVPAYSPEAVAEHTVALVLALNRNLVRAHARIRENNFALEGLLGFNLHGACVGIIGTGRIGLAVAEILKGFGCRILAYDPEPTAALERLGGRYVSLAELFADSDVVTLHCPLVPATRHLIDEAALASMKQGVMIINTSRGGVLDTRAVIEALKSGKIGYLGLDVYEEEADLFFEDQSDRVLQDDVFARLQTFSNVLITGHQAFFTREALTAIAETTIENISAFEDGRPLVNALELR